MAHSKVNVITKTYSGKLGNICMQHDGVIKSRPDISNRKWSEKQEKHLSRFKCAKAYGRQVVADPQKAAFYAGHLKRWKKRRSKRNIGIYQLAIMDFMHSPKILTFELRKDYFFLSFL